MGTPKWMVFPLLKWMIWGSIFFLETPMLISWKGFQCQKKEHPLSGFLAEDKGNRWKFWRVCFCLFGDVCVCVYPFYYCNIIVSSPFWVIFSGSFFANPCQAGETLLGIYWQVNEYIERKSWWHIVDKSIFEMCIQLNHWNMSMFYGSRWIDTLKQRESEIIRTDGTMYFSKSEVILSNVVAWFEPNALITTWYVWVG